MILIAMKYNDFGADIGHLQSLVKASIAFLLRHFVHGNFATVSGSKSYNLVHFCHGAPGTITSLAKFTEMYPE